MTNCNLWHFKIYLSHFNYQCEDYKAGKTGGNLCHDLCIDGEIVLNDCIAHKNTTLIFFGQWRGHKIVFKTKKEPHVFDTLRSAVGEPPGILWRMFSCLTSKTYSHLYLQPLKVKPWWNYHGFILKIVQSLTIIRSCFGLIIIGGRAEGIQGPPS